jgi:hypothetical protein
MAEQRSNVGDAEVYSAGSSGNGFLVKVLCLQLIGNSCVTLRSRPTASQEFRITGVPHYINRPEFKYKEKFWKLDVSVLR